MTSSVKVHKYILFSHESCIKIGHTQSHKTNFINFTGLDENYYIQLSNKKKS